MCSQFGCSLEMLQWSPLKRVWMNHPYATAVGSCQCISIPLNIFHEACTSPLLFYFVVIGGRPRRSFSVFADSSTRPQESDPNIERVFIRNSMEPEYTDDTTQNSFNLMVVLRLLHFQILDQTTKVDLT